MAQKKLRFAIFGNIYQAKKSVSIQKILSFLSEKKAEVYVDKEFYEFLTNGLHIDVKVDRVFEGDDFEADYVISMGGEIEEHVAIMVETEGVTQLTGCPFALNDIAVLKRDNASMISIRTAINGEHLVNYLADGLIVSTPTGSTAYSLSNGGPIIAPQAGVLCLSPVAPHSLNVRPIVVPDDAVVRLRVESRNHNFLVAIDGRSEKCAEGTTLTIRKAPYQVRIIKRNTHKYFHTLREKMMWGADSR